MTSGRAFLTFLFGAAVAAPGIYHLWGFTVDDALISARYAHHLATGHGYRFNPAGPVTDGVTPLGWALLLAPFARQGALPALGAAKVLGAAGWLLASGALAVAIGGLGRRRVRYGALLLIGISAPLAAWSAAGMETGLVLALGAAAVVARCAGREAAMAVCAGLVAGLRPETLPWAVVLALGPRRLWPPNDEGRRGGAHPRLPRSEPTDEGGRGGVYPRPPRPEPTTGLALHKGWLLIITVAPFIAVALVRQLVFGRFTPLALLAKPSDLAHGWRYALACALLAGPLAIVAWRRLEPWCRGLQAAVIAQLLALAVAGGDGMPLSRLLVPVLPTVVVAAGCILEASAQWIGLPRLALALAGQLFVLIRVGPSAAGVGPKRAALIAELRPVLAQARVIAVLDVGWVGVAAPASTIVDLAGVTDPAVAVLPGGHTSKRLPSDLLASRKVDTLVLLLRPGSRLQEPWTESRFARSVEQRLAWSPGAAEDFRPVAVCTVPTLPYLVLRRPE